VKIAGQTGKLTAGGREVAELGAYALVKQEDAAWAIDASVICYNSYWLEHAPELWLRVDVGQEEWLWRECTPTIDGGRLSATVTGEPEKVRRNGKIEVRDAEYRKVGTVRR